MFVCLYVCMFVCLYVCMFVCLYVCICVYCMHMQVCNCVCVYIYMCVRLLVLMTQYDIYNVYKSPAITMYHSPYLRISWSSGSILYVVKGVLN